MEYIFGGIAGRYAQAEEYHRDLAKFAGGGKHRIYKPPNVTVGITCLPARYRRRRYCCRGPKALKSDL